MDGREVRWIIQVRLKSNPSNYWVTRGDLTYTGWFYSDGEDKESEGLIRDFKEAVETQPHLDVQVVKEIRSINVTSAYRGKVGVIMTTVEEN